MVTSNGFNNKGNIIIAIFLLLAWVVEIIFLTDVGAIKYFFGLLVLLGSSSLAFNTEIPIPASKFWVSLIIGFVPLIIILALHSSQLYEIK